MARPGVYSTDMNVFARRMVFMVAAAVPMMPALAAAATVEVTVGNVHNDHGRVLVALCTKADFLRPHCAWKGSAPAARGNVVVRIADVPPGTYAAQAFHDENANGRLDRNLLGLPEEGMGFSHDAPMRMGPPRFAAAAFTVGEGLVSISFRMHY